MTFDLLLITYDHVRWVHFIYVKTRYAYILSQCRDAIYRVSTNIIFDAPMFGFHYLSNSQ